MFWLVASFVGWVGSRKETKAIPQLVESTFYFLSISLLSRFQLSLSAYASPALTPTKFFETLNDTQHHNKMMTMMLPKNSCKARRKLGPSMVMVTDRNGDNVASEMRRDKTQWERETKSWKSNLEKFYDGFHGCFIFI